MYILIIILAFSSSIATSTAEFHGLEACQKAAAQVHAATGVITKAKTLCIKKVG